MEPDDLPRRRPDDLLTALVRQDLDPLSVAELAERVAVLETEIARTQAKAAFATSHRAAADTLFRR